MSEQHAALITAARAWVEAERASDDAEAALRRARTAWEHADRDTHSNYAHASIAFERAYRAALAAQSVVLTEARKAVLARDALPRTCCECGATMATARLWRSSDGLWNCTNEADCARRCQEQRNEEVAK